MQQMSVTIPHYLKPFFQLNPVSEFYFDETQRQDKIRKPWGDPTLELCSDPRKVNSLGDIFTE